MTGVEDAREAVLGLLADRDPAATICPSEAARRLAGPVADGVFPDWRAAMPLVHAAVDRLLAEGAIGLSWKGEMLPARGGPYRIARAPSGDV